jgi:MYXO-CTERM domain-containing protein
MKKLLLTAAAILATLNIYGQGQGVVSFTSVGATDASGKKIQDPTGAYAGGSAYRVALYWGAGSETDDRNLVQIGASTTFLTGASAGTYFGGGRTITTPGSTVNGPVLAFQVRGWTAAHGATYEEALQNGAASVGRNPIFTLKTKDPGNALETTPNLYTATGYQGFRLTPVPEPSAIALGVLGVGALLMLRRRK